VGWSCTLFLRFGVENIGNMLLLKNGSLLLDCHIIKVAAAKTTNHIYEVESINRSQMNMKHKTCDIRTWKKHLFLDISSTNFDTLAPSLYQCVETRSIVAF
jgi:hypothetical protein